MASGTSVPGKVVEQIILSITAKQGRIRQTYEAQEGDWEKPPYFYEWALMLTNPKGFCDDMTAFMDVGKTVGVLHLNFSKEFELNPVSCNVITN